VFLSKLILNLENPQARRDLADAYEMHRTLTRLVAERKDRLLWRLEPGRGIATPFLLVQTLEAPSWKAVFAACGANYGELAPDSPKEFHPVFLPGQRLRFRLRANPSVMRNRKRYGLLKKEDQLAWLERKLFQAGTRVLSAEVVGKEWLTARRTSKGSRIELLAVTFEGFLLVEAPEQLLAAVKEGVGHGKAFGLGLLSLAKG